MEDTIFVYSGDKLVAEYSTTPKTNPKIQYVATDTLGSVRAITDQYGQIVSRRDFMPFGEELQADATYRKANLKYNPDDVRQKFTGYQKDEETGLDFAEARMYNNAHARFTAVDPLLASGKSANPQSFNRYAYVMNNPLAFVDPDGLQTGKKPDKAKRERELKMLMSKPSFVSDGNSENIKTDNNLTSIFTDIGVVTGASNQLNRLSPHYQFKDGQLHTIHVYGNETGTTDAGVYIPKEFSDLKITSKDTVAARNPDTGEVIIIDHVKIGSGEKNSLTNKTLRENIKTVRDNGTIYIGQIGGEGGEGDPNLDGKDRHSHLTIFKSEAQRVKASREKSKKKKNLVRTADYTPDQAGDLGDFRTLIQ